MENPQENLLMRWPASECPFRLEYDARVLEEISRAATCAFLSLPRGGPEIGGILMGRHEEGRVTITGSIAFDCEHAFGPSFILSQHDEARLGQAVAAAKAAGDSEPVGWYHSHTRSEIFLSAADQGVYQRFFAEPWHVALVVRPNTAGAIRAGFFFRERDGSLHAEASYYEFVVDPPMRPAAVAVQRAAPVPEVTGQGEPAEVPEHDPSQPLEEPPAVREADAALEAEDVPPEESTPEMPPESTSAGRRRAGFHLWLAAAAIIVAAGSMAAYRARQSGFPHENHPAAPDAPAAKATIRLVTIDDDGQLQILWDPSLPLVQRSPGGTLEIQDGTDVRSFAIDPARLQTGSFTYGRQSERVDVTLSINRPDGGKVVQVTTYVGRPPGGSAEGTNLRKERDDLAKEVAQLKSELAKQSERAKKLERLLEIVRKSQGDHPQKSPATAGMATGK